MIFLYKYFAVLNVSNVLKNSYVQKQYQTIIIISVQVNYYGHTRLLFSLGMIVDGECGQRASISCLHHAFLVVDLINSSGRVESKSSKLASR
jgi:hypothetical protein